MGHKQTFFPPAISEDCKGSACYLTMKQMEMTALECLPDPFLTNLGDHMVVSPSVLPTSKQESSQNKGHCQTGFSS